MRKMYYVYILRCQDHSLYTGMTTDVGRRYQEHLGKGKKVAKYTRTHGVMKIEAVWECESRSLASKLEYHLKKMTKKQKEMLIQENNYLEIYLPQIENQLYLRKQ